jgi:hypothetical protein
MPAIQLQVVTAIQIATIQEFTYRVKLTQT